VAQMRDSRDGPDLAAEAGGMVDAVKMVVEVWDAFLYLGKHVWFGYTNYWL